MSWKTRAESRETKIRPVRSQLKTHLRLHFTMWKWQCRKIGRRGAFSIHDNVGEWRIVWTLPLRDNFLPIFKSNSLDLACNRPFLLPHSVVIVVVIAVVVEVGQKGVICVWVCVCVCWPHVSFHYCLCPPVRTKMLGNCKQFDIKYDF